MRALGKPVLGYTNIAADVAARARDWRRRHFALDARERPLDGDRADMTVEDFGLAENLMIAAAIADCGFTVVRRTVAPGTEMTDLGGFAECLAQLRASLG